MQIFNMLLSLSLLGIYGWLSFPGMTKNRHYGDLFVNLLLIAGILIWQPCLIWRLSTPEPNTILSSLLMPLIELLYGPWL